MLTTGQIAWFRRIGGHSMKKINAARALFGAWAVLAVLLALAVGAAAEGTAGVDVRSGASINVQNGSF